MGVFVVQLGEGLLAVLAAKWSFTGMGFQMNPEDVGVAKGPAAELAFVRSFVGVDPKVYLTLETSVDVLSFRFEETFIKTC